MSKNNNLKEKIVTDEDFINYPKFSNSLKELMQRYPDGVEDEVIAKALMIPKEEVQKIFQSFIQKTRSKLGIK